MSREEEIRNINTRRKNILFLVQRYLQDNGMFNSAEALKTEAHISDDYELCDNVDLDAIYLEYASYYQLKFGKYPKILRKAKLPPVKVEVATKRKKKPPAQTSPKDMPKQADIMEDAELQVTVTKIDTNVKEEKYEKEPIEALLRLREIDHGSAGGAVGAIVASVASGGGDNIPNSQDWHSLSELVRSTILRDDLKMKWHDVCGNAEAMEVVKEAVVAPLKYPQLFAHGLKPWKSVLLHGPPGSGKTLLAKVLYSETCNDVTFFNVTASVLVSKWRGESEKILRVLFNMAEKHAPSIVFLDEVEGLASRRDRPTDHESSKRFKNELLQLLDGMEKQASGVFILASTNLPWDIDEAFLRRFEKKLLVQLPNEVERAMLIGKLLPATVSVSNEKMEQLVRLSENFTGDEIRLACKEVAMQSVRRVTRGKDADEPPIERAFEQVKPISGRLMTRHQTWQQEHGS